MISDNVHQKIRVMCIKDEKIHVKIKDPHEDYDCWFEKDCTRAIAPL